MSSHLTSSSARSQQPSSCLSTVRHKDRPESSRHWRKGRRLATKAEYERKWRDATRHQNALQAFLTHFHERPFDYQGEQVYDLSTERHQTDPSVQCQFIAEKPDHLQSNSDMYKQAKTSNRFDDIRLAMDQQRQEAYWKELITAAGNFCRATKAVEWTSDPGTKGWLQSAKVARLRQNQRETFRTYVDLAYRDPKDVATTRGGPTEKELADAFKSASFLVDNPSNSRTPSSIANMIFDRFIDNDIGLHSCDPRPSLSYTIRVKLKDHGGTYAPTNQIRAWRQYQEATLQEAARYEAIHNMHSAASNGWQSSATLLRSADTQPATSLSSTSPALPGVEEPSKHFPFLRPLFKDHFAPTLSPDPQLEAASEGIRILALHLPESLRDTSAILLDACDRFIDFNPCNEVKEIDRRWLDTESAESLNDDAISFERNFRRPIFALRDLLKAAKDDQIISRLATRSACKDYVKKFPKWTEMTEECRSALNEVRLAADKMTGRYKISLNELHELSEIYSSNGRNIDQFARFAAGNTPETTGETYSLMKKRYGCQDIAPHLLKTEKERRANSPWMWGSGW